jgi:deoxyribonuclease V
LAHPRRFGLACHVGVCLGWPTIGCAKSRLMGNFRDPGQNKGCQTRLLDGREVIGMVVRTRKGVKCLYVSVGHQVSLVQASNLVLRCCRGYRLPEPTRLAHQAVTRIRNSFEGEEPAE